jgi:cytochrome c
MQFRAFAIAAIAGFAASSAIAAEGDVKNGKTVFKKCSACHFVDKEKNRVGPHLVGIIDRKAGVVEKYKYSKALLKMAEEGLVWDEKNLHAYLEKPRDFIKGGKMAFAGLKDEQDRADVIAYLKEEAKAK